MKEHREVRDFTAGLPMKYLLCRASGHKWRLFRVDQLPDTEAYYMVWSCPCGAARTDLISKEDGESLGSFLNYTEAPGYLSHGLGLIRRARFRLELAERRLKMNKE